MARAADGARADGSAAGDGSGSRTRLGRGMGSPARYAPFPILMSVSSARVELSGRAESDRRRLPSRRYPLPVRLVNRRATTRANNDIARAMPWRSLRQEGL